VTFLRSAVRALAAAALFGGGLPAHAAGAASTDALPVTRIQDLHYGDVLFQLYVGEDFEALTRLGAYSHWAQLSHHRDEAELLTGGLYLQLGMHNEAGRRFESLLASNVPSGVRNRAWFQLARVWYARGYLDRTVESLARIDAPLARGLDGEKQHLWANALIRLERYDEAIRLLEQPRGSPLWLNYAKFNLGVALVRSGRLPDADRFLTAVGTVESTDEELLALRDRANLALGYAYLQADQPAPAIPALERVRLAGPQSSRALLGLGWAQAALEQYRDALQPWLELRDRNLLDAAVQESFIAVPYAFDRLGAKAQAVEYYEKAIASFGEESGRIDASIGRIRSGDLLAELLPPAQEGDTAKPVMPRGWGWQLQALPDGPESRYLYPLLAGNDFQEGLKNFRDLDYLGSTLLRWDENMVVYSDMVEARERAYAERTPRVDALLASDTLAAIDERRARARGRYNDVVSRGDHAALGTAQQREQWRRIEQIEAAIAANPGDAELAGLRDKLRLAKGVLAWDLDKAWNSRLYQEQRELRSLDRSLEEAHQRWLRVERARQSAPSTTGDFAVRIAALQERLTSLRTRLASSSQRQGELLADIAVAELEAQKGRIAAYELQARYALAGIYDEAAEPPK
jgi:hypothetical protein